MREAIRQTRTPYHRRVGDQQTPRRTLRVSARRLTSFRPKRHEAAGRRLAGRGSRPQLPLAPRGIEADPRPMPLHGANLLTESIRSTKAEQSLANHPPGSIGGNGCLACPCSSLPKTYPMLGTPDSQGSQGASYFASNFRGTATVIEQTAHACEHGLR